MNLWQRLLYSRSGDVVREVVDLLTGDPGGWYNDDGYWLRHRGAKVDIWIATEAWGLTLRVWPLMAGFPGEITPRWGESSLLWSLVKLRKERSPESIKQARAAEVLRQRRKAA